MGCNHIKNINFHVKAELTQNVKLNDRKNLVERLCNRLRDRGHTVQLEIIEKLSTVDYNNVIVYVDDKEYELFKSIDKNFVTVLFENSLKNEINTIISNLEKFAVEKKSN